MHLRKFITACLPILVSLVLSCTSGNDVADHQVNPDVAASVESGVNALPQGEGVAPSAVNPSSAAVSAQLAPRDRGGPVQPQDKLDSDLRQVYQFVSQGRYREAKAFLKDANFTLYNDASEDHFSFDVELEALMGSDDRAQQLIESQRGTVLSRYHHLMVARVTPALLMALARSETILIIHRPNPLIPAGDPVYGAAMSEGVKSTLANLWHQKGFTGKGVKVAIIDSGFAGYKDAQASGDLPKTLTTKLFAPEKFGVGTNHGALCAEVVHDMAPDAGLYLVQNWYEPDFLNAVDYLIAEKVDVVSASSIDINSGPYDGSSRISKKIDEARAKGILWVNAAGNEAKKHWEGPFQDNGKGLHVWKNGDTRLSFYASKCPGIMLSWNDWGVGQDGFPGGNVSGQAYILRIFKDGNVVNEGVSNNKFNKSSSPTIDVGFTVDISNAGVYEIEVERVNTTGKGDYLDLYIPDVNNFEYPIAGGSIPNMADAEGALTVGAIYAPSDALMKYSGNGPTNGKGGGAPDATSRIKPDLVAPTDVAVFNGDGEFGGTSAATPHVAGAAALVKQAYPSYTPTEIQDYLEGLAKKLPNYPAGKNNAVGSGGLLLMDSKILGTEPIVVDVVPAVLNISSTKFEDLHPSLGIFGFNFSKNAKIVFDSPNISNMESFPPFQNATKLSVQAKLSKDAKPGWVGVTVINDPGTPAETKGKGLLRLAIPSISSVFPQKQIPSWAGSITLNGDVLPEDILSADLGSGIQIEKASKYWNGTIRIDVVIEPNAPLGLRDVIVTNTKGEKIVGKAMFEVVSALKPEFVMISPNKIPQGAQNKTIVVVGKNFTEDTTFDLGDGVTVQQIVETSAGGFKAPDAGKIVSGDIFKLKVQVQKNAPVGPRSITISKKTGSVVAKNAFEVIVGSPPQITAIVPNKVYSFPYQQFHILGKNFVYGSKVTFKPEPEGNNPAFGTDGPSIMSVNFYAGKAVIGKLDITVTNPDGLSDTMVGALEVVDETKFQKPVEPPPSITGVPDGVPILTVPKNNVKTVDQKTTITSGMGLLTVKMECGGGIPIMGVPTPDTALGKTVYSFNIQIGPVPAAAVCQIAATDLLDQTTTASFQVLPGP